MHIEKWIGKLWSDSKQLAGLLYVHTCVKCNLVGLCHILNGRTRHFVKKKKIKCFYTLYHPVSDAIIKRLQPFLSYNPCSKPLTFIFLHSSLENTHLWPPGTLSLAQHPFSLDEGEKKKHVYRSPEKWKTKQVQSLNLKTLLVCVSCLV